MTTAGHTPGPWVLRADPLGAQSGSNFKVHLPNGAVAFTSSNDDAREANARLIAAAPEMFEALEAVFEDWLTLVDIDLNEENPDCLAIEARVRAAIAKARGGQA